MFLDSSVALGLGAMRLSSPDVDEATALRIVREALDRGVRLFDTADVYAPSASELGHNERLLAKALGDRRGNVVVATKGGLRRRGKAWMPDGRAKHLQAACEASLKALAVERIDLYQLHAVDPKVPLGTSVRALARLRKQGKIRHVGLSNVRLEDVEAAREIVDIAAVQVELSVVSQTPLKNGLVRYCAERGIRVLAHSPLGGHRRAKRLSKQPVLQAIAKRHGVSPYEIALAWLRRVDPLVVPIPGATRVQSLVSSLHALGVVLTAEDLAELDEAFPAGSVVRTPRPPIAGGDHGEVVLFVGYPGAGKSTLAERWVSRGYERLNRDAAGGTLAGLLPELDRRLRDGSRRIVLDNTYPRRESRFDVVALAREHRVPVRCVWLDTTLEQAQVNAVRRMLSRYGRLLEPEEIRASNDPNTFAPDAQFRYRRALEPPRADEGFSAIETVPFVPREEPARPGKAIFLDALELSTRRRHVLTRHANDGYRLLAVTHLPGGGDERAARLFEGIDVDVYFCPHPPGGAVCWCRKPLPGLGVVLIEKYALDPARCLVVGDSAADRSWAERLGFRHVGTSEFFGDT